MKQKDVEGMTMFHTDVSPAAMPHSTSADSSREQLSVQETVALSRSSRFLLHALRNRLVVVTAAAEMLDPVSTGPDSPAWTWGGTLRDEVVSLGHMLDSLEATLPIEAGRTCRAMLAQELTASTIRLFKRFGLSGRGASLPDDQDIAVEVKRAAVGTLFDMLWTAQISSAEAAKRMKLSITKDGETATVRIASPVDKQISGEPINKEALTCVELIATNLGVDLDIHLEGDADSGGRSVITLITFFTDEKSSRKRKV